MREKRLKRSPKASTEKINELVRAELKTKRLEMRLREGKLKPLDKISPVRRYVGAIVQK